MEVKDMDQEKLNRIVNFGEDLGFVVRAHRDNYATFEIRNNDFRIEVVYDAERKQYGRDVAYISTSSLNEDDLNVWRDFTAVIQKAVVLADKLKETKVNGRD
jgi:hypothetical protein